MGIMVKCRAGHGPNTRDGKKETIRELAREFSRAGTVGLCPARKGRCRAERDFYVAHKPPDKPERTFDVVAVKQVYSEDDAKRRGRDPMVFLLRDRESGDYGLWTYYWIKDRNGNWANGQLNSGDTTLNSSSRSESR